MAESNWKEVRETVEWILRVFTILFAVLIGLNLAVVAFSNLGFLIGVFFLSVYGLAAVICLPRYLWPWLDRLLLKVFPITDAERDHNARYR